LVAFLSRAIRRKIKFHRKLAGSLRYLCSNHPSAPNRYPYDPVIARWRTALTNKTINYRFNMTKFRKISRSLILCRKQYKLHVSEIIQSILGILLYTVLPLFTYEI